MLLKKQPIRTMKIAVQAKSGYELGQSVTKTARSKEPEGDERTPYFFGVATPRPPLAPHLRAFFLGVLGGLERRIR
jgi:hypothetical protein